MGITLGVVAALNHNKTLDYTAMVIAMAGICIVPFVLGPLFQIYLAGPIEWLNVAGWERPSDIILPAFTLCFGVGAYLARLTRGGMLDVLSQDYIRTAKAKGVAQMKVISRHAIRPALMPAITYLGPAFAAIITGSFVVETIFQIPGMGRFYVQAAFNRDYTMILGMTVFFSVLIVLFNLMSDILAAWMNPRLRAQFGEN